MKTLPNIEAFFHAFCFEGFFFSFFSPPREEKLPFPLRLKEWVVNLLCVISARQIQTDTHTHTHALVCVQMDRR